ncbi:MAG: dephospho-CoA kinase [Schleiferiaceae bacterium]|nr:dephospho-CoA kinase [Schleiferiaceae bacterium]
MPSKHIGLTGSIGAGKSTVANLFAAKGIPVYVADDAAKRLMAESPSLKAAIEEFFGPGIYLDGVLQRKELAAKAFGSAEATARINALVHPAVHDDFVAWHHAQTSPYILREAAILFESGTFQTCDAIILVETTRELRIERVMQRAGMNRAEVEQRMARQWPDAKKRKFLKEGDFIVENDSDQAHLEKQVEVLHAELLRRCHQA